MDEPFARRPRIGAILLATITISLALITLFSLEPFPFLREDLRLGASAVGQILVQLVTVVGAIAVIVGVLNLMGVHMRKIRPFSGASLYSLITILTLLIILALHILERAGVLKVNLPSASDTPLVSLRLMDALQVTVESALAGLLFFFLVFAAYRMLRRRVTIWGILFIVTLVIVLIGQYQPAGTFFAALNEWIIHVPVNAGTRGLLIGIAIGTVAVGARVLLGQDRIFRD
jgi:hypothetical protein